MDCSIRMEGAARAWEPAGAVAEAAPILDRVASVRERVFQVVRNLMPIDTLFTPELKIDLARFIEDQELFVSIADFLSRTGAVTKEDVAKSFKGHELEKRIAEQFKNDAPRYLDLFYENCERALQSKDETLDLQSVFEGRIFTLKNGLVAQHQPQAIQKSQKTNGLKSQGVEVIQKGGANFIEQSIRFYLAQVERREGASFVEELTRVANGLIPFLQTLTRSYLEEYKSECPRDPLTFRNPSSYNHHGLAAATLLEVALKSLGFNAKLIFNGSLHPKVTSASTHGVVVVTSPDGKEFIVDPTCTQFHEDLYPGSASKLQSPVLILERGAVDDYVEYNFMKKWEIVYNLVKEENETTSKAVYEGGCSLQYRLDRCYDRPIEGVSPFGFQALKKLVKEAYMGVWGGDSYYSPRLNLAIQELFFPDGKIGETSKKIQAMNLLPLLDYESEASIIAKLHKMDLTEKTKEEYLSLLARLSHPKRAEFLAKLDADPREVGPAGIDAMINAYFHGIRRVVNPKNADFTVVYGCSGADITSVIFATNATNIVLVDMTPIEVKNVAAAIDQLFNAGLKQMEVVEKLEKTGFFEKRSMYSGSSSSLDGGGIHIMPDLEIRLAYNLYKMKIGKKITITPLPDHSGVTLNFKWQHHHDDSPKKRSLTFITADITKPASYPSVLKKQIKGGFDAFFMKAAMLAPFKYKEFLPQLAKSLRPNGFLMTADKTFTMQHHDPMPILDAAGLKFSKIESPLLGAYSNTLKLPFSPIVCNRFPQLERHNRNPVADETYWTVLTLRQKSG